MKACLGSLVLSILSRWLIQICLCLELTSRIPENSSSFLITSLLILSSLEHNYFVILSTATCFGWARWLSQYSDLLRAGRSGDRIPVGARFSAPVHTGPGAHPASCTMGTGSFPRPKSGRGVTLTSHPLLVPWLIKE